MKKLLIHQIPVAVGTIGSGSESGKEGDLGRLKGFAF
jgi:hypothetical protein